MMTEQCIESVDWQRPWFVDLLPAALPILQSQDWRMALNAASLSSGLRNYQDLPIRFVHQDNLPPGRGYEDFIGATGLVPTRDNLHDFFNALVWLTFPKIKSRLNALQVTEILHSSLGNEDAVLLPPKRGKLRDAATIFDENAALLITSDHSLIDDLRAHRWSEVFIQQREAFGSTWSVSLFGHALMEKLVAPYKAITAHVWVLKADAAFFSLPRGERLRWLDSQVSGELSRDMSTTDFSPLPVLGLPGWCDRQDDVFYQDESVFRPRRKSRHSSEE